MKHSGSSADASASIPEFHIYGEPARDLGVGFLHVEKVRDRNAIHRGEVGAHMHEQMGQITYWTCGSGCYRIEDGSLDFSAPAVSFVPSGVAHGFSIAPDADAIVISISNALLSSLSELTTLPLGLPHLVTGTKDPAAWLRLDQTIAAICEEQQVNGRADDRLMPLLLAAALTYLGRLSNSRQLRHLTPAVRLASELRAAIDRHYHEALTVDDYVGRLNTTRYQLERAAKQVLGQSIKEAVLNRRLIETKRLLLFTIRSVEEIAYETGFSDPAYFSRFFTKRVGRSPAAWRRDEARLRGPGQEPGRY
ncbi:helix-turn-helix domain-containing protein [Aurantimonas sp. VKM B-3413]|uniref:helix-turn-helix domain-containing protein n=1 Tax=Aurantimonas sp. VKM B-3413 TaxID=2779401 RepID=UPI001E4033AF|nr:helix-turn-helix domain-containing protein [Aurantimonas sp. VKM B-3413]MCB8836291.1 helix-turn-helix domain-containing protein [Aurantimonas sp. VKM B-3413]